MDDTMGASKARRALDLAALIVTLVDETLDSVLLIL